MEKSADAYRTISEVADELKLPQHVLRFWETRFPQVKPMKRGGNRRFYRPGDVELLRAIKTLLYGDGFTIKGVQRILKEQGPRAVASLAQSGQLRSSVKRHNPFEDRDDPSNHAVAIADEQEKPLLADAAGPQSGPRTRDVRGEREPSGPDDPTSAASEPQCLGSRVGILDGLQAVLFELSECERILTAARG